MMRWQTMRGLWTLWAARVRLRHWLVIALIVGSVVSGLATYAALTRTPFFGSDASTVMVLSLLDLGFLVALGTVVGQRVWSVWVRRQRNQVGSRLHIRMINSFVLIAAAPALLVAMFAAIFFYFGVEAWFSNHVRTSLNESLAVAQAYLEEHKQVLRADALAMANDINRQAMALSDNQVRFTQVVSGQAYLRNLTEVIVFNGAGKILARSGLSFALSLEPVTDDMMKHARQGDVVLIVSDNDDRVRALVRLDNFVDTYMFVGRPVEPKVLAHMETTQRAVNEYKQLEGKRFGLQVTLSLIFVVVALLLLLSAVWFAMNFAGKLVHPISDLIHATDRVRRGDLAVRVREGDEESEDELDQLARAFNRMTHQIEAQRDELMDANQQLDQRRLFTEAVLAGVSSGVIGVDGGRRISLMNTSAAEFFAIPDVTTIKGIALSTLAPELDALIDSLPSGTRLGGGQVEIKRSGLGARTLLVRVSMETQEITGLSRGLVVTFDDVSDLVSAQRKAAWADVARRIAHEIKNPLTPIQLSAERLKRKYAKEIQTDPEVFQTCTDTIVRHVDDIGRMVDEFSAFARMPTAVLKKQDIRDIVRQSVFLQTNSRADIAYQQFIPADSVVTECDGRQIAQALTNLLKNAAEAIDARGPAGDKALVKGEIIIRLICEHDRVALIVEDNGKGLPVDDRHTLTEPYVTTRVKGTGLGLAIVKKIMEDHHGHLTLSDRPSGGAIVTLVWPVVQPAQDQTGNEAGAARAQLGSTRTGRRV